jgi:hypothetical protein
MHLSLQINRLAGLAVMLHCFLPGSWVPPLQTPSAMPDLAAAGGLWAAVLLLGPRQRLYPTLGVDGRRTAKSVTMQQGLVQAMCKALCRRCMLWAHLVAAKQLKSTRCTGVRRRACVCCHARRLVSCLQQAR